MYYLPPFYRLRLPPARAGWSGSPAVVGQRIVALLSGFYIDQYADWYITIYAPIIVSCDEIINDPFWWSEK